MTTSDVEDGLDETTQENFSSMTNERLTELFRTFIPVELLLETIYVPFLPEYCPSIGDVDPFIKVGRPDGKVDELGLNLLDEPCLNESDPTVLESLLMARAAPGVKMDAKRAGTSVSKAKMAQRVKAVANDKAVIEDWIEKVEKVHQTEGTTEFTYSIPNPGETILEIWDEEMENILKTVELPKPTIDLSVEEYAKFCSLILDIPVSSNIIESMHMLFTNYEDVLSSTEQMRQQGYLK